MRAIKLDWIRCFAGFWVVLFHCSLASESYFGNLENVFGHSFFLKGHSGVALFFSLSGFLISRQILFRDVDLIEFSLKRIKKLIPMYYFFTFLFFFISMLKVTTINSNPSLTDFIYSLLFIQNSLFEDTPVLYVGWSLEYEFIFYILCVVSLIISYTSIFLFLGTCLLAYFWPLIYLPFLFGIICAVVEKLFKTKFFLPALLMPIICICAYLEFGGDWFVMFAMGIFLLIPGKFIIGERIASLFSRSTYSIYLIQVFTIPIIYKILRMFNFDYLHGLDIYLAFLCTIGLGTLCYIFVEKKLQSYFTRVQVRCSSF
jgi:exopolysaccharide production protein ExoZ